MHEENTGKQVRVFGELVRSNNSVPVVSADGVYDYNQTDEHGNKKTQEQLNEEFKTAIENGVTISTTERQTSVKLVEGTEFRVEAGTGVKVGKWGEVDNSIEISADTDVLATKTELATKADKADTYTKEQVDVAIEDVAFLGDDDGQAVIPEFDPQTDTLLKTTQSLTNTEKETVIGNILDKNYIAGRYVGKGKKYLKLNVGAPVATDFDGFVDGATTEQSSLAEVPDNVYFDRTNNIFIASKGEGLLMKYYMSWQNGDAYMNPNSGVYFKNGNDYYQWNGTTLEAATVGNVNKLTQADFDAANTIYVIRYDFDLCGQSITIPEGCVLEFDGGSLSNGSLIGNGTEIKAGLVKIFETNLILSGTWTVNGIKVEWFGAKGDNTTDSTLAIQKAVDVASIVGLKVLFNKVTYNISNTIDVPGRLYLGTEENYAITSEWDSKCNATLSMTSNAPIIHLSDARIITIENVTLLGNVSGFDIDDVDNSRLYGIYSDSENVSAVKLKNIIVRDCTFGIYIKLEGYKAFSLCYFDNIHLCRNVIGLYLTSTVIDGRGGWYNHNSFKNCTFSSNHNIGVFLENGFTLQTFKVEQCLFEHNGNLTTRDNLLRYGTSGINVSSSGTIDINNCYFEDNMFSDSALTSEELSYKEANIVTRHAICLLKNNIFSSAYQLVSLYEYGGVVSYYNRWYYSATTRGEDTFVSIRTSKTSALTGYIVLHFKEQKVTVGSLFKYAKNNGVTANIESLMYSSISIEVDGYTVSKKSSYYYQKNPKLYLGSNGNNHNVGFFASQPIASLDSAVKYCDNYDVTITSNIDVTAINRAFNGNVVFSGADNTIEVSATENNLLISESRGKAVYKNLIFNINKPSNYKFISGNNCNVEFYNCTFNCLGDNRLILVRSNKNVVFNNCTFNRSGSQLVIIDQEHDGFNGRTTFVDCTNTNILTIWNIDNIDKLNPDLKNTKGIGYDTDNVPKYKHNYDVSNLDGTKEKFVKIIDVSTTDSISAIQAMFDNAPASIKAFRIVNDINLKGGTLTLPYYKSIYFEPGGRITTGNGGKVVLQQNILFPYGLNVSSTIDNYEGSFYTGQILTDNGIIKRLRDRNDQSSWESLITTYGTFAEKPTNPPIGHRHFCTDKQTTEGTTDGIEIIHKGNDVWVDALGRTIS